MNHFSFIVIDFIMTINLIFLLQMKIMNEYQSLKMKLSHIMMKQKDHYLMI